MATFLMFGNDCSVIFLARLRLHSYGETGKTSRRPDMACRCAQWLSPALSTMPLKCKHPACFWIATQIIRWPRKVPAIASEHSKELWNWASNFLFSVVLVLNSSLMCVLMPNLKWWTWPRAIGIDYIFDEVRFTRHRCCWGLSGPPWHNPSTSSI